jgi:hypothetical protein
MAGMGRSRAYRALVSDYSVVGTVSATEVTWSPIYGWHPHFHSVWFFSGERPDCDLLAEKLFALWHSACSKHGLVTKRDHNGRRIGVDVRAAWDASEYLAKFDKERGWSVPDEMTGGRLKLARGESLTPWAILEDAICRGPDSLAYVLWLEYLRAMRDKSVVSREGARTLLQRYDMPTSMDDFADANRAGDGEVISTVSARGFDEVVRRGGMGSLMEAARRGGVCGVDDFLSGDFFKVGQKKEQ